MKAKDIRSLKRSIQNNRLWSLLGLDDCRLLTSEVLIDIASSHSWPNIMKPCVGPNWWAGGCGVQMLVEWVMLHPSVREWWIHKNSSIWFTWAAAGSGRDQLDFTWTNWNRMLRPETSDTNRVNLTQTWRFTIKSKERKKTLYFALKPILGPFQLSYSMIFFSRWLSTFSVT